MKTLRPQKSIAGHTLSNTAVKALLGAAAFGAGLALTLLAASPAKAATGNPEAAKAKMAMCIGCHGIPGYQASFPEVHKVPMIAGQSAAYLAASLTAYQKGDRKHPTMKGIAASLSEQDILDLSAYYEALGKDLPAKAGKGGAPSAAVTALLQRGNCLSCHGENLNKPIDPSYPKLAGQHGDYLYVALKAYQTQGSASMGRNNAIMAGQVKGYTHAELKQLAQYIESLGGDLKTVPQSRFK